MKINLHQIDLPFQVGQHVYIKQPLYYWSDDRLNTAPYFSGVIKLIEVCFEPKSRFIREEDQSINLVIDRIRYEILPHSHFNPFGLVQIFDRVEVGSKLFQTELGLLQASGTEPSLYLAEPDLVVG